MENNKDILNTAEIPYEVRMKYIIARTMGTGDRLAVEEEENLIPESGIRFSWKTFLKQLFRINK